MTPPTSVVIAGGGVAALEALLALRALAGDRVTVELIAPEPHFWYRPLAVAEPFGLGHTQRLQLSNVASDTCASFTLGSVTAVDAERRIARTSTGADVSYDVLLLACGAAPEPAISGSLRAPTGSSACPISAKGSPRSACRSPASARAARTPRAPSSTSAWSYRNSSTAGRGRIY